MVRHATRITPPRIATRLDYVSRSPQAIRMGLRPHAAIAPTEGGCHFPIVAGQFVRSTNHASDAVAIR